MWIFIVGFFGPASNIFFASVSIYICAKIYVSYVLKSFVFQYFVQTKQTYMHINQNIKKVTCSDNTIVFRTHTDSLSLVGPSSCSERVWALEYGRKFGYPVFYRYYVICMYSICLYGIVLVIWDNKTHFSSMILPS